jgi:hypothetical protein
MKTTTRSHSARSRTAKVAGGAIAVVAFLAGGMAPAPQEWPARLNGLHVQGFSGYPVFDVSGVQVGQVISIDADAKGRTRHVRISLIGAGELSVPAFRAYLNVPNHEVSMTLPADILYARYDALNPA